jgi:hypothetical protein
MLDKGISADGNSEANVAVNHKGPRREQRTEVIKGGIGSEHAQGGSVGVGRRDTLDEKLGHGLLCAVEGDNIETVCGELRNMFEYFRAMRTTKSHLRYVDYLGNVLDAWGKTGGQQGDPLEMIVFCLSVHHLWGRTLAKYNQDACAVACADDGYIRAKLSVALEVLSDLKHVLKEDAGLSLNFDSTQKSKTKFLVKGISATRMLAANPSLDHLRPLLSPALFVVGGYIGLGVPIGTDAFIQHFVKD